MMWHYFPIGFRFPVEELTEETKRRCWQTTLAALYAAGGTGVTLYDTVEPYDYGSDGPVYTCIACFESVKQSRPVGKNLYAQDDLMAQLCMLRPFAQANYLENFGPYPQLGTFQADGTVERTEADFGCFPHTLTNPKSLHGKRLLLVSEQGEAVTRTLGKAATDAGFPVDRVLLPGNRARVRAMVTMLKGRYDVVTYQTDDGIKRTETIGILPGVQAIVDPSDHTPAVVLKALDLGLRRFLLDSDAIGAIRVMQDSDARLKECTFATFETEEILKRIGFDAAAAKADAIILLAIDAGPMKDCLQTLNKPFAVLSDTEGPALLEAFTKTAAQWQ